MTKKEKLCLQLRNKDGQNEETYCRHYIKTKSGYFRLVFFGYQPVFLFCMSLIFTLVRVFAIKPEDGFMVSLICIFLAAVPGFVYLCKIFVGLWYWKYSKNVFVTDEGIWVIGCSSFWWRGAPDFLGRRRLLAPYWSLYGWGELKRVAKTNDVVEDSKIYRFFDAFDDFVGRSSKTCTLYMKRFDGVERIDFLKKEEADEILAYMKERKKNRRKKQKEDPEEISAT